jgi:hypothetical protein
MAVRNRRTEHVTILYLQKLALKFANQQGSLSIVGLWTKNHGVCLFVCLFVLKDITVAVTWRLSAILSLSKPCFRNWLFVQHNVLGGLFILFLVQQEFTLRYIVL